MRQTLVGTFDRMADAERAVDALRQRGIDDSDIQVTASDAAATDSDGTSTATHELSLMDRIRNFFSGAVDSDDEVGVYSEHLRRGGAVVRVDLDDEALTEVARAALESAGAVDIDERASAWRASGWSGPTDAAASAGAAASLGSTSLPSAPATGSSTPSTTDALSARKAGESEVIPVVREDLLVSKRSVRAGGVRVYARVVEEAVRESVELREERARVERRPVDRPASVDELGALGERSIEIEETVERPVVQKTARVVEEVVVGKDVRTTTADIHDSVRHTEVEVSDLSRAGESASRRAYEDFDSDFRSDFSTRYGSTARYEDYEPAYRYGHGLAADERYRGQDWDSMETHVRSDWETRHPGSTWEKVKAAVRHAWERATQ